MAGSASFSKFLSMRGPVWYRHPGNGKGRTRRQRCGTARQRHIGFNPVWGQGMSVAAEEAVVLRRLLGRGGDPLARLAPEFFAEAGELIETPWAQAAIPDFALPQTTGQRPPDLERRLKFGGTLSRLAAQDPEVHRLVVEVRHLLKPSSALRDLVERVEALMAEA
jgi:hypothetical protein